METRISFLLGRPWGRPGGFTDEEWGAGLEDLGTQSTSDTRRGGPGAPQGRLAPGGRGLDPRQFSRSDAPWGPNSSSVLRLYVGGLREAERLAEPPPPPARPGSLGPAAPPRAQHQVARQTRAAGPLASAASAALGSVLPSLSVLPANKGQFDIPKGFGTQGHLSAGAGPSEQLRKRRWPFGAVGADRPGPSERGVTRMPASVALWAKPVSRGAGRDAVSTLPLGLWKDKGSHTGNPWERSLLREDSGGDPDSCVRRICLRGGEALCPRVQGLPACAVSVPCGSGHWALGPCRAWRGLTATGVPAALDRGVTGC